VQNSEPPVPIDPFRKFEGPSVPIDVMLKTIMKVASGNFKLLEDPSGLIHPMFTQSGIHSIGEFVYVTDAIERAYRRLRNSVSLEIGIITLRKSPRDDTIP